MTEEKKKYHREYKRKHKEQSLQYTKAYQASNKAKGLCPCGRDVPVEGLTKCKQCRLDRRNWYLKHRDRIIAGSKVIWSKLKIEALQQYGEKCMCCGEKYKGFLVLDHIHGKGTQERLKADAEYGRGSNYYGWLKRHGWPKGEFQILCANCNTAKGTKLTCPCPYNII